MKKLLAGTTLAAILALGGGAAAFAATDDNASTTQQTPSATQQVQEHGHQGEHKKIQLTEQQKQAIKDSGVDFQAMKATKKQLWETGKSIRETHKQLKDLADTSTDKNLKKQIKADLKSSEDSMTKLKDLRKTGKDLHKQLHDAVQTADSAKIKDIAAKIEANNQEALKLMQTLDASLKAELTKVQGLTKQ
ncbi:hypothetical protein [Tumebacillus flagellatus]|uniref:DUF5667 domain-containing protein n=1 Tax=Tumebacillus flagellatus TaxID=1157490 RepID=A0A074MFF9_9BACL|nr:hypothetical protein [Tumebacillus flagellatus]KEO84512.1 hypothetical protein EL26_03045 [Tumebacillus flagellatus]